MKEQDFLRHYIQNAQHLIWFLGAGTSRTAGLPTANDIIWDLKRKFYCTQENQDVQSHDINNKAIRSKIQAYMDSRGFPALWSPKEYSFYFELLFGSDYGAQQKYLSSELSTQKVALTIGHRVLAALLDLGLTRMVFTTNFDEVVESAFASISGKNLSVFHLEGSYAALDALNAERFPIYAKIHGDFRYQSVKNLSADLLSNDAEIQRCFIASATRYGMVVSGYSGRDENVMAMFKQAIEQNNAFPSGFIWTTPRLSSVASNVVDLIAFAKSKGIQAHIVETSTFDEMLSKIWRQVPNKPDGLDQKVRTVAAQRISIQLPAPGNAYPILRTNGLLISKPPTQCGSVEYTAKIAFHEVKEQIIKNTPDAVIAYTDRLLYWGRNEEIQKVVDKTKITSFSTFELGDPVAALSKSPFLKSFYEEALARALCDSKPLELLRKGRTFYAVVRSSEANQDIYRPLRDVLGYDGKPGYITGNVPYMDGVSWAEAVSMQLEERNGHLWLLLTPEIWISPIEKRFEAKEFIRNKRRSRYNNKSNAVLSAWIGILLGKIGSTESVQVTCYPTSEQKGVFEISTRSAYSRRA